MTSIQPFLDKVNDAIINPIIAVLFVVALATFIWGIVRMIYYSESETELTQGKEHMMYGLFGMFIMISVFFIMQVIVNTFELTTPDGGGTPIDTVISS